MVTNEPQQVKAIVWCNFRNLFTQQLAPNHTSLKLEIEMLHSIDLDWTRNGMVITKDPTTAPNKKFMTDSLNCPDKVPPSQWQGSTQWQGRMHGESSKEACHRQHHEQWQLEH